MAPQGPPASNPPFTNRGAQLAEPWFRGAGTSVAVGHDSGLTNPDNRRYNSKNQLKPFRLFGSER